MAIDWRTVPVPDRMAGLPRHPASGFVVPFFAAVIGGVPDLKILDERKQLLCLRDKLCAICGQRLGYWVSFITGPEGVKNRTVHDTGMHRECAEYSLRVCPYLARPGARRAARHAAGTEPVVGATDENPGRVARYETRAWRPYSPDGRSVLLRLAPATAIEWWRDGERSEGEGA